MRVGAVVSCRHQMADKVHEISQAFRAMHLKMISTLVRYFFFFLFIYYIFIFSIFGNPVGTEFAHLHTAIHLFIYLLISFSRGRKWLI